MKAALLREKGVLTIAEIPDEEPGDGDVVVDVKACGVCGTDAHIYHGAEASAEVKLPLVMGHEFSGVVAAVGAGVKDARPGDRVAVNPNIMCGHCRFCRSGKSAFCENHAAVGVTRAGGFAQKATVPGTAVHCIERSDFDEAALIEPLSCCLNVFEIMPYKLGDAYLIVGGGPIGMMMLQLARMAGARYVAVSEPVREKRDKCLALGADAAFSSREEDASEAAARFGVKQFDAVIDCAGSPASQGYSLSCVGRGTRVMLFGIGSAGDVLNLHPYRLFHNQAPLYSSYINPYTFERAVEIVEAQRLNLKDIVSSRIGLDGLDAVLRDPALRSGGKVLVVPRG